MKNFFDDAKIQKNPLRVLVDFLKQEKAFENVKMYDKMRFIGYPITIGYKEVTIITSDPYKNAVGGIPRNSLLLMVPSNSDKYPPHFTLLRVLEATPTPLDKEVQETYFELQKKSMPELDVFTQSELQWGSFKASVLGMFYPHPDEIDLTEFSGDMNNFLSPHKYMIFAPDDVLLDFIINALVPNKNRFKMGQLRLTECRLPLPNKELPNVDVYVSTNDFMGTRTAMFGKTRLGKSNIVKLIAESLIKTTYKTNNVGQLIFDINGEYANDNPQDGNYSLASAYKEKCEIYALTEKKNTISKPLKLNFYEFPDRSHDILGKLLTIDRRTAMYVRSYLATDIPTLDFIGDPSTPPNERLRAKRKILFYWAILKKAGFEIDEKQFSKILRDKYSLFDMFNPEFTQNLRNSIYGDRHQPQLNSLTSLIEEFDRLVTFIRSNNNDHAHLRSASGNPLFDSDDIAILNFFRPTAGAGPRMIQPYKKYHDKMAGEFIVEIIKHLDSGKTVILDLGNAHPELLQFYSDELSKEIFKHQVTKFTDDKLDDHFIQLYFEEAHNLFPESGNAEDIYSRIAKEGAKYHIGMVYSTQSVSSINKDLLAQTENFFIVHLSSKIETDTLARLNVAYESLKDDILMTKTVGYVRMLTRSHRFVIPVQALKFTINGNGEK